VSAPFSKWKLLALIAGFSLVADQVTKYLAVEHLTHAFEVAGAHSFAEKLGAFVSQKDLLERGLAKGAPVNVVDSFWQHRYTQNRGAAFSFLADAGEKIRVPFFHLVTLGALIFVFFYYRKLSTEDRLSQVALSLVLGGALGNALDRLLRGYVIDFIAWHWRDPQWQRPDLHWPTFNIADSCISSGIVLLLIAGLFAKKPEAADQRRAAAGK